MMQQIPKALLKQMRFLKQKKHRRAQGLFVISGLRAVSLALESSLIRPEYLLIEKDRLPALNQLPAFNGKAIYVLNRSEFTYISDEKTPQGIALVARLPEVSLQALTLPERLIFLDQVSDPGNFGTILRTALWFNWTVILLGENALDPYQPKAVRASAGAIAQMRIVENVSPQLLRQLHRQNGYQLIATSVTSGKALPTFVPDAQGKYILAFGSEAHGLSREVADLSSTVLTVPKFGQGESLNLAIAVSLFLYQFTAIPKIHSV